MMHDADVLVIGAGPAGTATARECALNGFRVILADRAQFPRDKVCGDALIPDALDALRRMGLEAAVSRHALTLRELRVFPPDGPSVRLAGEFRCIPRFTLDDLLLGAAVRAGAQHIGGLRATTALEDASGVQGARFIDGAGRALALHAPMTVLATGANPSMLHAFGVGERMRSNATALRGYFQADSALARDVDYLAISYDSRVCPGYGWIFPGPGGVFNVGVGWFEGAARRGRRSLHALFDEFVRTFPLARRLAAGWRAVAPPRGAQIRTSLTGARLARPGLLVAGEAAGSTYAATGEGIGKALQTGLLAAEILTAGRQAQLPAEDVARRYARELRTRFARRFAVYDVAERWSSRPWMLNLLARRANRGAFVRRQLEALIAETSDPRALFSAAGLIRAFLR
jgi:flavin-dependent dehydrogenase